MNATRDFRVIWSQPYQQLTNQFFSQSDWAKKWFCRKANLTSWICNSSTPIAGHLSKRMKKGKVQKEIVYDHHDSFSSLRLINVEKISPHTLQLSVNTHRDSHVPRLIHWHEWNFFVALPSASGSYYSVSPRRASIYTAWLMETNFFCFEDLSSRNRENAQIFIMQSFLLFIAIQQAKINLFRRKKKRRNRLPTD